MFLKNFVRAAVRAFIPNTDVNLGLAIAIVALSLVNAVYDLTAVSYYIAAFASRGDWLGQAVGVADNTIVLFGDAVRQINDWIAALLFFWFEFDLPKELIRYLAPVTILLPKVVGFLVDEISLRAETTALSIAQKRQRLAELRDLSRISAQEAHVEAAGAWVAFVGGMAGGIMGGPAGLAAGAAFGAAVGAAFSDDIDRSPSADLVDARTGVARQNRRWSRRARRRKTSLQLLWIAALVSAGLAGASWLDNRFDQHTSETGCQLNDAEKMENGYRPNQSCSCRKNRDEGYSGFVTRTKAYQETREEFLLYCRIRVTKG